MSDFGVLSVLRAHLLETQKKCTNVHMSLPPMPAYPIVLLELEASMHNGGNVRGKVTVKAQAIAKELTPKKVLEIGEAVRLSCEGQRLKLPDLCAGMMCVGEIKTGKSEIGLCAIELVIDVLIRKKS